MIEKISCVKSNNKTYFESKARELMERRKDDNISFAAANLLFKSLNMKMENYLSSPREIEESKKCVEGESTSKEGN